MHIVYFNRSFWPDVESTGQLLTELCDDLSQHHRVTVVAGRPYSEARFGSWLPLRRERRGAVEILRCYNPRLPKRIFAFRVLNLSSYFALICLAGLLVDRPDVIVVQTDPPVLGLLGSLLAFGHRAKLVYAVQDLYPDVGIALGKLKSPLTIGFLRACTRLSINRADLVTVLGEDMAERLRAFPGVRPKRVAVTPSWVDCQALRPPVGENPFRRQQGWGDDFVVMYSGNLGLSQGLGGVLTVAQQLGDEPRLRFVLIGDGAAKPELLAQAAALGLRNVEFLPYQPKERLAETLSAADLHLVPLQPGLAGLVVPSKVYGILAAGRPYVASVEEESEAVRIARRFRCGLAVRPGDQAGLIEAIRWAMGNRAELDEMGRRGRAAAVENYDRRSAVARISALLESLLTT